MNRTTSVIIGLVLVAGVGAWVYSSRPNYDTTTSTPTGGTSGGTSAPVETTNPNAGGTKPTGGTTGTTGTKSGYTLAQVAAHNGRSSCWSAINGSVYDLTSWIPSHPGGEQAILSICGIDGTSAFTGQHGGDSRVLTILSGFKIGNLTS